MKKEVMMELSVSSDYATMNIGAKHFYYGYEDAENDEWCFAVNEKGKILLHIKKSELIKNSNLKKDSNTEMFLLVGIGLYYGNT